MRRRNFIAAAVAATATALPLTDSPALAAPDRVTGARSLREALNELNADLWETGAAYVAPESAPARDDLLQTARFQWAQAVTLTNRSHHTAPVLRARSLTTHAEASRQLGMIYADRGEAAHATRLYRLALGAANRAGNHELAATITTQRAYMRLYDGNYPGAVETAAAALSSLRQAARPGGRAAVTAYALQARAHAAQGNPRAAEAALRHAYGHMSTYGDAGSSSVPAPHHPQRFAWVKLRLATAETYAALGDRDRHERALEAALDDPSVSQMHRPMLDMGSAEVAADPATAAARALHVLRGFGNPPTPLLGRARALARRAAARAPRNDDVQALRVYLLTHTIR